MGLKKVQKQGKDERTQEDYQTSAKVHSRCTLVFFIIPLCFVSVLSSGSSLTEMKFSKKISLVSVFFGGFLNHLSKRRITHLLSWSQTLLAWGANTLWASDKHFITGDEQIEKECSNFSHTHRASYQRLLTKIYDQMIATHRHSPPKTGGSYHTQVLTS